MVIMFVFLLHFFLSFLSIFISIIILCLPLSKHVHNQNDQKPQNALYFAQRTVTRITPCMAAQSSATLTNILGMDG